MGCRHDGFKNNIDAVRLAADPANKAVNQSGCARFCKSMDDTLIAHIRCVPFVPGGSQVVQTARHNCRKVAGVLSEQGDPSGAQRAAAPVAAATPDVIGANWA